jgi:hypothetical protein
VTSRPRRFGCLIFSFFWVILVFITIFVTTFGDCADPGCEDRRETLQHRLLLGELALLVGVGWFFYRREMKDGGF